MKNLLQNYLAEVQKLSPSLVPRLNPPATMSEIESAEIQLNLCFPEDLRELLLCANGQNYLTVDSPPFFHCFSSERDGLDPHRLHGLTLSKISSIALKR